MTDDAVDIGEFAAVHGRALMGLAYVLTGDPDRSQDLVQSVIAQLLSRDLSRVDNLLAYARRSLINEYTSSGRRQSRRLRLVRRLEPPGSYESPESWVTDRAGLIDALGRLSEWQRAAVALRYLEDLDDREISAALDCTEATVRSLVSRGLARLKEILDTSERNSVS